MSYRPLSNVARRLSNFFSSNSSSRRRRYASVAIEALESRTLMSASFSLTGNTINIPTGNTAFSRDDFTDFGPMDVKNGAVQRTFTITNNGDAALTINGFKITGNKKDFVLASAPSTNLAAGASSSFTINFDPRATGTRHIKITIASNDPLHPTFTFNLEGEGLKTKTLTPGLEIATTQKGVGAAVTLLGQHLQVNYTGYLLDGTKFDSSLNVGHTPFDFTIGNNEVIQGWEKGLLGMKLGEKRTLIIGPDLAYGSAGQGNIPANATLVFDVQLLAIQGPTVTVTGGTTALTDGQTTTSATDLTDFGDLGTNGEITHTFQIGQTGTGILSTRNVNVVTISGADASQFHITQPFTTADNSILFNVTYQPTNLGPADATITVRTNDPEHPDFTFSIHGTAAAAPPVDLSGVFATTLKVPAQNGEGDTFEVPVTVTNFGWATANGTIRITVKASADGTWHDEDPTIGTAEPTVNLGKHASGTFDVPVTIPDTTVLPIAGYKLVAKIETVSVTGETNTDDNFVTFQGTAVGTTVAMNVTAAQPDLTVTVGVPTPKAVVYLPGDTIKVPVTITNAGIRVANASVAAPILVDVRNSSDATYDITDALIKQLSLTDPIAAGKSVTIMVPYTIPLTGVPANFFAVANADSGSTLTEINETNNTGASAQINAGIDFGFLGKSHRSVTIVDADGTKVKLSLTHAGVGTVTQDSSGYHVSITGSNAKTAVNIVTTKSSTPGDDGRFTVNSFTVGNPGTDATVVRSVTAKTMDVTGDFKIAGAAETLTLGNFTGVSTLAVGAGRIRATRATQLTLKMGTVKDVNLNSSNGIKELDAVQWLDTDATADKIVTPYIAKLNVTGSKVGPIAGDFQADLTLAGPTGAKASKPTLGKTTIAGSLSGAIWAVTGKIDDVTVKGSVTESTIGATVLKSVHVVQDVTNSHFTAAQNVGSTAAVGTLRIDGTMTGSDLRSVGNVTLVEVGALVNSLIFAGVKNTVTARPAALTDFSSTVASSLPRISTVKILGLSQHPTDPVLVNSSIAAGRITTAQLPVRDTLVVDPGSGLSVFGFSTRVGNVTHYRGPGTAGLYVAGSGSFVV